MNFIQYPEAFNVITLLLAGEKTSTVVKIDIPLFENLNQKELKFGTISVYYLLCCVKTAAGANRLKSHPANLK